MVEIALSWLPELDDFKQSLSAYRAIATSVPAAAPEAFARLAAHRHHYLTTLQLDRHIPAATGWPSVRVALIGSGSTAHLLPAIRVAGARRRHEFTLHAGDIGQHRQELMLRSSSLAQFRPDVVVFDLRASDILADPPLATSAPDVDAAIAAAVEDLKNLWRLAAANLGATVIQHGFRPIEPPLFGDYDPVVPASPRALITRLNQAVADAARQNGALFLDLPGWASRHGLDVWHDRAKWYHAKQSIAPSAAVFYGDLVARLIAASRGQSKKCLVLDLDNTLWGGVIGDDGLAGITLGQGSAEGEAYVAFQSYARTLAARGIILAVCSKNDQTVAEEAFGHPDMVLRREDIAVFVANWDDKPSNLRRIAETLNIGTDSLVFFDDNPAERAIVRQTLPEVFVPEVPADVTDYVRCLADSGAFEAAGFTAEDQARGRHYAASASRAEAASTDVRGFLKSLQMQLSARPFDAVDMARIVQLTGKTNQFNLTTQRHNTAAMEAFAADPATIALSFRLTDRFGDNGLIAVVIAVPADTRTLRIDTWLMSCRVLGRQAEDGILSSIVRAARALGATTLIGEYRPTPRNGMVRDLYPRLGFTPLAENIWSLDLAGYTPPETTIAVAGV